MLVSYAERSSRSHPAISSSVSKASRPSRTTTGRAERSASKWRRRASEPRPFPGTSAGLFPRPSWPSTNIPGFRITDCPGSYGHCHHPCDTGGAGAGACGRHFVQATDQRRLLAPAPAVPRSHHGQSLQLVGLVVHVRRSNSPASRSDIWRPGCSDRSRSQRGCRTSPAGRQWFSRTSGSRGGT